MALEERSPSDWRQRTGKNAHAAGVGTSQFSESLPFIFGDQGTFSESKKLSVCPI